MWRNNPRLGSWEETDAVGSFIATRYTVAEENETMAPKLKPAANKTSAATPVPAQPGAVSRENAEHYRWGTNCDAWYLVNSEQLSVIEEFMPPGAAEIRHHHEKAQQFFYILTGEVLMEVEGQTTLLSAGSGIRVLPGQRHQIRKPSAVPRGFLV